MSAYVGDETHLGEEEYSLTVRALCRDLRVMITDNSEYHVRDDTCVAVRQRDGDWNKDHNAVGKPLLGVLNEYGAWLTRPEAGSRLYFAGDLLTSRVRSIFVPARPISLTPPPRTERCETSPTGGTASCLKSDSAGKRIPWDTAKSLRKKSDSARAHPGTLARSPKDLIPVA